MKRASLVLALWFAVSTLIAQQVQEPVMDSSGMPRYPVIAITARVVGTVQAEFKLDDHGNVTSVEILSGPPLLTRATEDTIRTWKFGAPEDNGNGERKYKTTFVYRFSGRRVDSSRVPKLTVTFDSFHRIEVTTDPWATLTEY